MPSGDDYDDRPKKSWRDIDKARDGKRSSGGGGGQAAQSRVERTATYSRYKSAADKFFSGDLVPDALREKLDPTGENKAKQDALRKLKDADDFKEFAQLAREYIDAHGLPEDPYLLDRLLAHPNEGIVLKTVTRLSEMLQANELKPPKSLGQRLKSLELGSDDPELQDAARALAKDLRAKSLL